MHSFTIEQPLDCDPATAFAMWTDPASIIAWITPAPGWSATIDGFCLDLQHEFCITMRDATMVVPHHMAFLEMDHPHRIVFSWRSEFTNNQASRVTLRFSAIDSGTLLKLTHEDLPTSDAAMEHKEGWTEILGAIAKCHAIAG